MSEMVERARLAFLEELRKTPAWLYVHNCDVVDFRQAMRAAIASMREPTEAMLEAPGVERRYDLWHAMIDAALAE
jgi:hypothetical protein